MRSFEELAVLLTLDTDSAMLKSEVIKLARELLVSPCFDQRVALSVCDRLERLGFVQRDSSGYVNLTFNGVKELAMSKNNTTGILKRMVYG